MPLSARLLSLTCYSDLADAGIDSILTPTTVLCTIWAVILTIVLEIVTHWNFNYTPPTPSDAECLELPSIASEQHTPASSASTPTPQQPSVDQKWCPKSIPTPRTRATRFAVGLVIYSGVVTMFSVRMYEATGYEYRLPRSCKGYKELKPDWTAIWLLNIVPFVFATMAFARTVVDCVLVRYGMFLGNGRSEKGVFVWRPFVLVSSVFMIVLGLGTLVMGRAEVSMFTRGFGGEARGEDEEMGLEEEERGLIENVDGEDEGEPPAYEEAIGSEMKIVH